MERNPSPDHFSPDHHQHPYHTALDTPRNISNSPPSDPDMATMVAQNHVPNMPGSVAGINKRYRPAPAKTFQCRGYGECRMVFSRSEHLARHIRKHTGERPFSCHCGKQFSRLDNLRQHAQTVHADKQDQNERMMRDLTSLHASMAAANKVGHSRGGRRSNLGPNPTAGSLSGSNSNGASLNLIKQEDLPMSMHQRPGTSTGYEGDHNGIIYQAGNPWHVQTSDMDRPNSRPTNNHSFRDPGQSFLAPSASNTSTAAAAQSQSFLSFPPSLSFGLSNPTRDARPGSSSGRPPITGGSPESHPRLPPLSAVVSASFSSPPSGQQQSFSASSSHQQHQQSSQPLFSFPTSLTLRRPSTATRPGTAPASAPFYSSKSSYIGGPGLAARPELSIQSHGRPELGSAASHGYDSEFPASPSGHDSPFFYHAPPDAQQQQQQQQPGASPPAVNHRKRAFAGPDGPLDDAATRGESGLDYDYGSESRPQSRRLSVMELCNDPNAGTGISSFLLSGTDSRPTTSSGLVSSASALALVDRDQYQQFQFQPPQPRSPLLARAAQAAAAAGGGSSGSEEEFGGAGVSPTLRRGVPPQPPSSATTAAILSYRAGPTPTPSSPAQFAHSPTFSTSSYSPRSPSSASPFSPRSPVSDVSATVSRRAANGGDSAHDQIRIALAAHASATFGMRV